MKVHSTVANEAEKELSKLIGHKNRIYKPWQLAEHETDNVRISSSHDELLILLNEPCFVRPGFEVDDVKVVIPCFMSKFNYEIEDFVDEYRKLTREDSSKYHMLQSIYMLNEKPDRYDNEVDLAAITDENGLLNQEYLKLDKSILKHLKRSYQVNYIDTINRLISTKAEYLINDIDNKVIISSLLNLDIKFIDMYHDFDYQYLNPKVLILDNRKNSINEYGSIKLLFLHLLGFDVFIASEQGYASIENEFKPECYDVHNIEGKSSKSDKKAKREKKGLKAWFEDLL